MFTSGGIWACRAECGHPQKTPQRKTCHVAQNASKQGRHRWFELMESLGFSRKASWSEARDRYARIRVPEVDIGQQKPFNKRKKKLMKIRKNSLWCVSQEEKEVVKGWEEMKILGYRRKNKLLYKTQRDDFKEACGECRSASPVQDCMGFMRLSLPHCHWD